jgi:hypothetical protein
VILSVFMPAFEHVVPPRALRLLIPAQMEMLIESHQEILSGLKKRMSSDTKFYGFVGDIFSRLCGHSNVSTVAGGHSNVSMVAGGHSNVSTVAGGHSSISTMAVV